jgi:hypothetical protein
MSLSSLRSWNVWLVVLLLGALAGCGGASASGGLGGGAAGQGPADAGGDAAAATGAGGGTVTTGAAGSTNVLHPATASPTDPSGVYLTSESESGRGVSPCANTTLGDVLTAIRAADPTLADIQTIYDPATATSDGSFIYAYDVGVLGLDIVFKRGLGDCPAGCTENDYRYFSTDASCHPVDVGHYHAAWGTGSCLTVDGAPMWGHPSPPDPLTVCGADNSARDLRGTYALRGTGQRTPCAVTATSPSSVDVQMKLLIEQNTQDLSTGTVTFSFTGDPLVDGVPLPATFQRDRFDATFMSSNLPNACPRELTVTAHYDFEGYQPGGIEAVDLGNDSCAACKGSLSLALSVGGDFKIP